MSQEELEELAAEGDDEGLADYLRRALAEGMDLNDWLEREGWPVDIHQLERTAVRFMHPSSWVLEVRAGSGRFSRHLVKYLTQGRLHLVDQLPWKVSFLRRYFRDDARVHVHLHDGFHLPAEIEPDTLDLVCSFDTFQFLKLGEIYQYAREFGRVLKPGGCCVFDFLDITTEAGWHWLEQSADDATAASLSYFTPDTLERVFAAAGLEPVPDGPTFEGTSYLTFRKP